MKVFELIDRLEECPQDWDVVYDADGILNVEQVNQIETDIAPYMKHTVLIS